MQADVLQPLPQAGGVAGGRKLVFRLGKLADAQQHRRGLFAHQVEDKGLGGRHPPILGGAARLVHPSDPHLFFACKIKASSGSVTLEA